MKRLLPYLLVISLGFAACSKTDNVIANTAIDAKTRNTIKSKNDSLILGLTTGKQRIFKRIANEHFLNNIQVQTNNLYRLFMYGILKNNYTVFDEYEVRDKKQHDFVVIENDKKGYTFSYSAPNPTSYVCIMQFKAEKDNGAIAAVYGLEDGKWKLDRIDAFIISVDGKTPVDLYNMAKKAEEKGDIYEASSYATNAALIVETYKESKFQYKEAKAIALYKKTIQGKIHGPEAFPHVLEDIPTKPAIISMFMQPDEKKGMRYTITYRTEIPIASQDKLEAEYEKVKVSAQEFFTGLNFKTGKVAFKAVNMEIGSEEVTASQVFK